MKKVVWTVLAAVTSTGAAALALRGLRAAWTGIAHEEPPAAPTWARWLIGGPLRTRVASAIERG